MADVKEVRVPDIGDFAEVDVIEVLVAPGDRIEKEQSLITLESDKASMEVPSSEAGVVKEVKIKVGDKVSEGDVVVLVEAEEGGDSPAEAPTGSDAGASAPAAGGSDAPAAGGGEAVQVKVPDIGDFAEVDVIEVLVSPGDTVEQEQSLITLESDKASMEVPSSHAGVVKEVKVKVGDKVSEGDTVAVLESQGAGGGATASAPAKEAGEAAKPSQEPAETYAADSQREAAAPESYKANAYLLTDSRPPQAPPPIDREAHRRAHASPAVRRFARELGVDLGQLQGRGSGRKGRILKEDVQAYVKQALAGGGAAAAPAGQAGGAGIPPIPEVDFSKFGEVERQPLSRIQKLSGPHLQRSWLNVPHVTQFDEADITELEAFRKSMKTEAEKAGVKLTPLAFMVKASAAALRAFPRFNSSLAPAGDELILKKYVNIGVAVDTPNGLVVPVIRDADRKSVYQIAEDLGTLSAKARDGKLGPSDMQGGCFTISSLGGIGGTAFTPIVNAPEVAILGVSRSSMKPVWNGSEFEPRLMLPLSLSYDHRVIDGAAGARFTAWLAQALGDIRRLLL
ncbi:dihydrolipoyllysine-residue acetyltransferase [Alkalilimnicola ehrlichii MLHE-1]|uniref:Acetyltransferase component of pyruvate dehydrogenase complex n=1 Tax=Alkalilimnicola ehrlichii (strain ATCC BAA-1101 / DSM 17681 / MLHE-1) TaxID=187272 RepID=Q0AC12_ALKEH|nr:dihydrolipoyllysine-residue acetyltransferase [Alkalilimnicola ehrlichii]ABI55625.1 pyruvate dehydrogenase complex dihydrolipoamide acetyltransferase [Alkalilimnicola ehrlichii MLHE-1]